MGKFEIKQEFKDIIKRGEKDLYNPGCIDCNECYGISTAITKREKLRIRRFLLKGRSEKMVLTELAKKCGIRMEVALVELLKVMNQYEFGLNDVLRR